MAKYLVTGAAGFIASRVCDLLLNEGHTVVGLDNLNNSYDPRLKDWRLARFNGRQNFQFQKRDIGERAAVGSRRRELTSPTSRTPTRVPAIDRHPDDEDGGAARPAVRDDGGPRPSHE